ncbi:hypothetical protein [Bradyrhizobium sp. USDA 10063]
MNTHMPAGAGAPVVACRAIGGGSLVIDDCPYCHCRHHHGTGDLPGPFYGHRLPHCEERRLSAASVSRMRAGYYLVRVVTPRMIRRRREGVRRC